MTDTSHATAPSPFVPGQDVLLIEVIDPGSAGDALEIDLVLDPFDANGAPGTIVSYRATGPGLDDREKVTLARLSGVSPHEFTARDVIYG